MPFRSAICLTALAMSLAVATAYPAVAALIEYAYEGAVEPDCAVEELGGATASCQVKGSFVLDDALFGTPQFGLEAEFSLFIDHPSIPSGPYDSFTFPPFEVPPPLTCVEYCNDVVTDVAGNVTDMLFKIIPPAGLEEAIFIREDGWSWDIFTPGFGVFSGADGATITRIGPVVVPVPPALPLLAGALLAGLFGVRGLGRRGDPHRAAEPRVRFAAMR